MTELERVFEAHFRRERAIAAARRFISRFQAPRLCRSDVLTFLRRRRERLPEDELIGIADAALQKWMSSEERHANQVLLRRARGQ